jgi:hypothetical protein
MLQLCFSNRKENEPLDSIDWSKQFPVVSINRADLTEFGFTDEQIATLFTDEVMRQLGGEMQTSYHLQQPFWKDFEKAIKTVLGLEVQTQRLNPSDPTKKFEILTISKDYLQSIGMEPLQVARLTDEDMTRIAEILVANLFDSEFDEEVKFTTRLVLEERRKHHD